jgi:cold shock CspA family protein
LLPQPGDSNHASRDGARLAPKCLGFLQIAKPPELLKGASATRRDRGGAEGGFGFVRSESASEGDVFVHITAFDSAGLKPGKGMRLEYDTKPSRVPGRLMATDLRFA